MADISQLFSNTTFSPKRLQQMGAAFDLVAKALPNVSREEIAFQIIDLARTGVVDASPLATQTFHMLSANDLRSPLVQPSSPTG